jgi:hypothetical protein
MTDHLSDDVLDDIGDEYKKDHLTLVLGDNNTRIPVLSIHNQIVFKYCELYLLILIIKVAIDATGPRVLNFFSLLVLYCLTVISLCTRVLSCLGSGSGYRAC